MRCLECSRLSAAFVGLIRGHAVLRRQEQALPKRRSASRTRLMETALTDSSESLREARCKLLAHEAIHHAQRVAKIS